MNNQLIKFWEDYSVKVFAMAYKNAIFNTYLVRKCPQIDHLLSVKRTRLEFFYGLKDIVVCVTSHAIPILLSTTFSKKGNLKSCQILKMQSLSVTIATVELRATT